MKMDKEIERLDEHFSVGIAYSLMGLGKRFDKKIGIAYDKTSDCQDFEKQWQVFVRECKFCIQEFSDVMDRIEKKRVGGKVKK